MITRCRTCKFFNQGQCSQFQHPTHPEGGCEYGEKRKEGPQWDKLLSWMRFRIASDGRIKMLEVWKVANDEFQFPRYQPNAKTLSRKLDLISVYTGSKRKCHWLKKRPGESRRRLSRKT